ncbi:hypothetical protein [Streptomyces sp. NRRL WC-3742]|uniref:hypothetical protein n=1 Tax=Streptomyces sp. NRRL WC-3742 TaxID=1463934 RepID=UPI000A3EA486|nr:hypothetical protein [Streptomyces sp. NRRL WC-3742]
MNDTDNESPEGGGYPFADGRNMAWHLGGYGADDWEHDAVELDRDQYLTIRHLFADGLGDDAWMAGGVFPVPDELRQPLQTLLGLPELRPDLDYFLGGFQNLPGGGTWRPGPGDLPAPGPIPPP